jgi:hypothetical protein
MVASDHALAFSLDDIQLWTGSGSNSAALVIEWSTAESLTNSSVPLPRTDKTLVWGYRFNGSPVGATMLRAIAASDPRLYVVIDATFGTFVEGLGYNLDGTGVLGITDGKTTNTFSNGILSSPAVDMDAAQPINRGDLYWGGVNGPTWELWTELGDAGGFSSSPYRGTNLYWTADNVSSPYSGVHGQWEYAQAGLDGLTLANGSWIALSVASGEYEAATNAPYNLHKHAPPAPEGTYVAYVCNTNDFAIQILSTSNVYTHSPYNDPTAVLGRPTLRFIDGLGDQAIHRVKIVEPPYWTDQAGHDVITEISPGGQLTVRLGRKVYDDPNNPYGIDLVVYGNSYIVGSGTSLIGDGTDLDNYLLTSLIAGQPVTVSVSQDGTAWYTYSNATALFPQNAYRWDNANHSWTDEELNPTKPLNPSVIAGNFGGQTCGSALEQFIGAAGGTGYDLKASGLPWIQYVRVEPGEGTSTVIDAIAAVDPVLIGDALSITPDNLASGVSDLFFQNPANSSQNLISLGIISLSMPAKVNTVELSDFVSFTPVAGKVSSAYQLTLKPLDGTSTVSFVANVGLRVSEAYTGNGTDLRVFQWSGANWSSPRFRFDRTSNKVLVAGVTNLSAFVVSQMVPPQLRVQALTNGFAIQFTPLPNCTHVLERSTDFVTWMPIATNMPASDQILTLLDAGAPPSRGFYRLVLSVP